MWKETQRSSYFVKFSSQLNVLDIRAGKFNTSVSEELGCTSKKITEGFLHFSDLICLLRTIQASASMLIPKNNLSLFNHSHSLKLLIYLWLSSDFERLS